MLNFMKAYEKHTYALLRIVSGFLYIWHGTSKYFSYPRVSPAEGYVLYLGGAIELIAGVLRIDDAITLTDFMLASCAVLEKPSIAN